MSKPKSTPEFQKAYANLNSAQKEAVDAIEGPVMVIAGPGTGKTQVLTLRIANILLSTDTPPDALLALTFTEAGVFAMKTRLASLIGPTAYSVRIHTFHSFCNALIKDHPSYFKRLVGAESLLPIESITIMREVLDGRDWEHLTSFADKYVHVRDILASIATMKREYISPAELRTRVTSEIAHIKESADSYHTKGAYKGELKGEYKKQLDKLSRSLELVDAYERYEELLRERRVYDFEDMIVEVLSVFSKNKDFLQMVQEEFLYILADEHQDANTSQNTLLTMLSSFHESPNLFLVGDEKQAIYSFQGASLEHFHAFSALYPSARVITLTDSYRSGTKILEASHSLMSEVVESAHNQKLTSMRAEPHLANVHIRAFSTEEHELAWVAEHIKKSIAEGVAPQEIAILFRNNHDAEVLSRVLVTAGVPHINETKQNALEHHRMQQLLTFMRACADVYNERAVSESLFAPWSGVSEADIHRITRAVHLAREPLYDVLSRFDQIPGIRNKEAVQVYLERLTQGGRIARNEHARDFFSYCVEQSGFLKYTLINPGSADILSRVRGMLSTLEQHAQRQVGYSAKAFLDDMELYRKYNVQIDKDMAIPQSLQSVHLMTAHSSKGLEFSHVYIIHARDKKWGNARGRTGFYIPKLEKEGDDDERRLMYVALTRARDCAFISYGKVTSESREVLPSLFIESLGEHATAVDVSSFESGYKLESGLTHRSSHAIIEDAPFLRGLFEEQGLSVTALNNYLECPWRYFYRNLVRIPDVTTNSLMYGNGIHAALQDYFSYFAEHRKRQSAAQLVKSAHVHLSKQGFTADELKKAIKKAETLPEWLKERDAVFAKDVIMHSELPIELLMPLTGASIVRVLLRGKIDRLDIFSDGTLRVTDYKTGTPRTRNDILGLTKNSSGDYYRQLVFYKLCMTLEGRGELREACIDFIEPQKNGSYRLESFSIEQQSVDELKELIARVAEEIYTLSFWDKGCKKADCEYCTLRADIA